VGGPKSTGKTVRGGGIEARSTRRSMAARTTPRAAARVAAKLWEAAAADTRRVVPWHATRRFAPHRFSNAARGITTHRRFALPPDSALKSHPIMQKRFGRYSIDDFALVVDEIPLGEGLPVAKIVRPESEDAVLDMYVELGLLGHDPYWAALWPSSVALARGVAEKSRRGELCGKSVCDLGAGLGLAGIAAAVCGARSVTFYDREPLALQCCLLSAEANGLAVSASSALEGDDDVSAYPSRDENRSDCVTRFSIFDWNRVPEDQIRFDMILACDVLYEKHAVEPVAALVTKLTAETNGIWLLADPPSRAPKNRESFLRLAEARGVRLRGAPRRSTVSRNGSTDAVLLMELETR